MRSIAVEPSLSVTKKMFEVAQEGLLLHTPGLTFTWNDFTSPQRWFVVPDDRCLGYKAEFLVERTPQYLKLIYRFF